MALAVGSQINATIYSHHEFYSLETYALAVVHPSAQPYSIETCKLSVE